MENSFLYFNGLKPVGSVYPSTEITIGVEDDKEYGGAHSYKFRSCLGFQDGETVYADPAYEQSIQFVHKASDGTITPGLQSEQLVIALIDRHKKLNERFPSVHNEKMIQGLEIFLEACKERIDDRISRGVMGELKK